MKTTNIIVLIVGFVTLFSIGFIFDGFTRYCKTLEVKAAIENGYEQVNGDWKKIENN